jgi:hypothetical protein
VANLPQKNNPGLLGVAQLFAPLLDGVIAIAVSIVLSFLF